MLLYNVWFSNDENFCLDGKANKMCISGVLKIHAFSEKMHYAAKITVWASLLSHWTIKLLFLKNSVKSWAVHDVKWPFDVSICCDYLPIYTQCFMTHSTNINLDLIQDSNGSHVMYQYPDNHEWWTGLATQSFGN
jgi:hypothetical protein